MRTSDSIVWKIGSECPTSGVLPLGMTKIPFGYPMMFGDFLGFAQWAIGSDEIRDEFEIATGISLSSIIPRNGLEAMIDKATGCTHKETFASFLDWLTTELWGEDQSGQIDATQP